MVPGEVSNIEGLVNSLKEELAEGKEETKNVLSMVDLSITRFKETIQDLMEITKAQKNVNEDITNIDLNTLLEEIKISIKDMIRSSGAKICSDLCHPEVKFSKANLKSILYNLVSNAIKYRHPDRIPEIYIRCENKGSHVVLTIKDNGLGIPEKQRDKLFVMFKRFHDHVEGSGVGLYLVKRIIDNSGGKIEVDSKVGYGTTFTIYLRDIGTVNALSK